MKRSEIVKRIANVLSEAKLETDESLAKRVLNIVELSGMLPPDKTIQDPEFPHLPNYQWEKEEK